MTRARVAAALGALLSVAFFVASDVLVLVTQGPKAGPTDFIWAFPFAAMAVTGAFVASRRPRNATGWLFLGAGLLFMSSVAAQDYAKYATATHAALPALDMVAWLGFWTWMPATVLLALVLIVFPTGRPPNAFWRWVVRLAVALLALTCAAAIPVLGAPASAITEATSASSLPGGGVLGFLGTGPLPMLLPLGFIALAIRFVRAKGIERQQMKWFAFAASLLVAAAGISVVLGVFGVEDPLGHPLGGGSTVIAMTAIPFAAGIAILRYRLYEIDRIISRTVSYAAVTAILGGVFALCVLLPPLAIGGEAPDYVIAVGTLVVAALFRPVRRRVQNTVDHRFNRKRYDAEHTIEAFTMRLREQIDIDALGAELRDVVSRTMQPSGVSLWIKATGRTLR